MPFPAHWTHLVTPSFSFFLSCLLNKINNARPLFLFCPGFHHLSTFPFRTWESVPLVSHHLFLQCSLSPIFSYVHLSIMTDKYQPTVERLICGDRSSIYVLMCTTIPIWMCICTTKMLRRRTLMPCLKIDVRGSCYPPFEFTNVKRPFVFFIWYVKEVLPIQGIHMQILTYEILHMWKRMLCLLK